MGYPRHIFGSFRGHESPLFHGAALCSKWCRDHRYRSFEWPPEM